jgi:transcriptional regulator with GAF, ATPase, and Fis domain
MRIDEVASLVGAAPPSGAPARLEAGVEPLDAIARAILALPTGRQRLRDVERAVVVHALARTKGNVSAAARLLGTDRKALERRIERHRIAVQRNAYG